MEPEQPAEADRRPLVVAAVAALALAAFIAVAFVVNGRRQKAAQPAAHAPTRAWPADDAPRVQDQEMLARDAGKSSIALVERPREAAKAGQDLGLATDPPAEPAAKPAAPRPDAGPVNSAPAPLTPAEKAQLDQAAGDISDPKVAAQVGGTDRLWTAALKALSHHPRVLGFLVNNDLVVRAFMVRAASKQNCASASAFRGYLSDTKRPGGVSHAMDVVDLVAHGDPAMPGVMFGSKLADAMMSCPSVQALKGDPAAIGAVAQANPRALMMMQDPAIMVGLSASPRISAAYQGLQDSLGR